MMINITMTDKEAQTIKRVLYDGMSTYRRQYHESLTVLEEYDNFPLELKANFEACARIATEIRRLQGEKI